MFQLVDWWGVRLRFVLEGDLPVFRPMRTFESFGLMDFLGMGKELEEGRLIFVWSDSETKQVVRTYERVQNEAGYVNRLSALIARLVPRTRYIGEHTTPSDGLLLCRDF